MIYFNDGSELDAKIHFLGSICTIYTDQEPNESGFNVDGFDCSDFTTVYMRGEGFYQLSNNGKVAGENPEKVMTKKEYEDFMSLQKNYAEMSNIMMGIESKKEELRSTDYIIIKEMEGCDMSEYDIASIKKERQRLRDEINGMEKEVKEMEVQNGKSD